MYILNLKIHNVKVEDVNSIIESKLEPQYSTSFDEIVIYYIEKYSVMNANKYLVSVVAKQRGNNVVISIVSGGAADSPLDILHWGTEKRSTKSVQSVFSKALLASGKNIKIEVLNDTSV